MTIAIIGPEKFAFQDLVCVDLALAALEDGLISMVPEQKGSEDATLSWPTTGDLPAATVEVQVKGATGSVSMAMLADYLLHYPDRNAKGSLLERLMDMENRAALFVMTARCDDILAPLVLDRTPRALVDGRPTSNALAEALHAAVKTVGEKALPKKPTKLQEKRRADAQKLAERPLAQHARALAHLAIVERETAETVEVRIHRTLQHRRFDTLSIRGILASLTDHLGAAKRSQEDVVPALQHELNHRAPRAVRPADYLDRGIENELLELLEHQGALLLTGPPRAGKSWMARRIGGELQHHGFEVGVGSHIDEAERFLTDTIGAARLYILDDPLGAREPLADASARLGALRQLIERLPPNRRLIVAQTDSVLLQSRAAATIEACGVGAWSWLRIAPLSPDRAIAIWRAISESLDIEPAAIERIVTLIERDDQLRDPGALTYLAQTFDYLPPNAGDAEILFQARSDAVDFACGLAGASPGYRAMLSAVAFATAPGQAAAISELAFIANGGAARPGFKPDFNVIVFGEDPRPPPAYTELPLLSETQQHAIDNLQRRRVLDIGERGFNFTHPYLRAGAQALQRPDIPRDRDQLLEQAERSLACVEAATSLAAARNLRWLRAVVAPDDRSSILAIASKGLRSLFPATRDACFSFLIDVADELTPEQRDHLPDWADQVLIELEDIDVRNGTGFIANQRQMFVTASPIDEIQPYLDAIDADEPLGLDLALGRRILLALEVHPEAMSAAVCRRFLRADEAVIRGAAAGVWLAIPREDDEDIIEWLAHDRAPSISIALLQNVASNWATLEGRRRRALIGMLQAQAQSTGCASVLFNRLVLFNRVEYFGEAPPWALFAELLPTVIEHLPVSVSFRNGRLNAVLEDAIEVLPADALVLAIEAWAHRLQRRLAYRTLDEYELAIVEPLLAVLEPKRRLSLLRDLIGVPDTGARIVTMKWLVTYWDDLGPEEQALLSGALAEDRSDKCWLAATVLTSGSPPELLVEQLTGAAKLLNGTAEEIDSALGAELFAACIRMYRGDPQPLWWYATHHSENPAWPRIVSAIARNPDHPLFGECFVEIASFGKKGELLELVDALPEAALMQAFELLLQYKLGCNGFWRDKSWTRLLERAESAGLLDAMFEGIDAVSDGILENLTDVRNWLGEGRFAKRLLSFYPRDYNVLVNLRLFERAANSLLDSKASDRSVDPDGLAAVMRIFIGDKVEQLEAKPCRLCGTWDALTQALRRQGGDAALEARIYAGREAALERHNLLRDSHSDVSTDIPLDGWVFQIAEPSQV
ncbi:nSTAND3 domain-containing NTPase [Palleronia aestuarii]|uniref:nSTAND3 domain-containing NTPase n=1 Tax=Palleronia aestuarii TaxID=568105 RepID=UPI0011B6E8D5|nr:hypothetical protein [Palleronia aestuarii]